MEIKAKQRLIAVSTDPNKLFEDLKAIGCMPHEKRWVAGKDTPFYANGVKSADVTKVMLANNVHRVTQYNDGSPVPTDIFAFRNSATDVPAADLMFKDNKPFYLTINWRRDHG